MEWNPLKWPILCTAGIAAIVIYSIFTFRSLTLYPEVFSPVRNWLSDLGNSRFNPDGAIIYNTGCILAGFALFPFWIGLHKWYTAERWRNVLLVTTQVAGLFLAFSLIMAGKFSEDYPFEHQFWSQVFFTALLIVFVLASTSLMTHPKFVRPIGYYSYTIAVIILICTINRTPLLELVAVSSTLIYFGLLVCNTLVATNKT